MLHVPSAISLELATIGKKQVIPVTELWVQNAKTAPLNEVLERAGILLTAEESTLQRKVVTTYTASPSQTSVPNTQRTGWHAVAFSKSTVWLHHPEIGFWPISITRFASLSQKGAIESLSLLFAIFDNCFDLFEAGDVQNALQAYQAKEQTCIPLEQLSTMAVGTVFKVNAFSYMLKEVNSTTVHVLNLSNSGEHEIPLTQDVKNAAGTIIKTPQIGVLLPVKPLSYLANLIKQAPLTLESCVQLLPTAITEYLSVKKSFILSLVDTSKETPTYVNLAISRSRKHFDVCVDFDKAQTISFNDTVSLTTHAIQQYLDKQYTGVIIKDGTVDLSFIRRF